QVNPEETRRIRETIRERRRMRAGAKHPAAPASQPPENDHESRWNDNLAEAIRGGEHVVLCRHCGYELARGGNDYQRHLMMLEGTPEEAGLQVFAEPWRYIDAKVVFRQYFCPGCATAFITQVVPENHAEEFDRTEARR